MKPCYNPARPKNRERKVFEFRESSIKQMVVWNLGRNENQVKL